VNRNISSLNKEAIYHAYKKFEERSSKESGWRGPSLFFHQKTISYLIEKRKNSNFSYNFLNEDIIFIEYLYATLATWGLHSMRGPSFMKPFEEFKKEVLRICEGLERIKNLDLTKEWNEIEGCKKIINEIFTAPRITTSQNTILVANSKLLHHLHPYFLPPVDRQFIIRYFYSENINANQIFYSSDIDRQKEIFWEILKEYHNFYHTHTQEIKEIRKNFNTGMETSVAKIIDNIVVGRVLILRS
jgi:hypothetical protein